MTPKERLALAMELTVPDRVPVMCQMSIGHMLIRTGHSPSEFWHSAAALTGIQGLTSVAKFLLSGTEVLDYNTRS